MSAIGRFMVSVSVLSAAAVAVGLVMADDDETIEWPLSLGLITTAVAGESLRTWLRRASRHDAADQTGGTGPGGTRPGGTEPGVTEPGVTEPGVAGPGVADAGRRESR